MAPGGSTGGLYVAASKFYGWRERYGGVNKQKGDPRSTGIEVGSARKRRGNGGRTASEPHE